MAAPYRDECQEADDQKRDATGRCRPACRLLVAPLHS